MSLDQNDLVLEQNFKFFDEFGIAPPYYAFLSFVDMKGYKFDPGKKFRPYRISSSSIQTNFLNFPEIETQEADAKPEKTLRPIFDMVWNAFGYTHCQNYDDGGNWVGR